MSTVNVLALSGSLRQKSLNTRALLALRAFAPNGVEIELASIEEIPFYNSDLEEVPGPVDELKHSIEKANGLLIATPEYNYGIPGVLKNAIDWVSRPAYKSVLAQKPVGILGASPGPVGTARAQGQLKQVLLGTVSDLFPYPELTLGQAGAKLGAEGEVTDEKTREQLKRFIENYSEWVEKRVG